MVAAPIERVWALHLDIAHWPAWQHDVTSASVDGPLAVGGSFTWTTAGLDTPVVSTIYVLEPQRAVLWGGPSAGIDGIHHWMFATSGTGTRVTTEESWRGPSVEGDPVEAAAMLAASLERWLGFLAAAAIA